MKTAFLTYFLLFLLASCFHSSAQVAYQKMPVEKLEAAYEKYKEPSITHRRFKHASIQPLIQKHGSEFKLEELGTSVEGKSITSMKWGQGGTKVMLWSQMHGNESTATMALFDLFNFLEGKNDGYDELRNLLKNLREEN